jgi:hypothetical protein
MRKLLVLLGALLSVAVAGAGVARANHSGPELRTYGHGEIIGGQFGFDFSARLGPREATDVFGEPHGTMKITSSPPGFGVSTATAEVVCMAVVGDSGTLVGNITRVTGPGFVGNQTLTFFFADHTLPGQDPQVAPDQWNAGWSPNAPPQVCSVIPPTSPLTSGDLTVEEN